MLEALGKTQQNLLKALLANKGGSSIDALAAHLAITRTAVRQHVTVLEGLGYLDRGQAKSTGGRPGQFYRLSEKGHGLFPKQYALFSGILLRAMLAEKGEDGLRQWLDTLGADVAAGFRERMAGKKTAERIVETVAVMNTLAYDASAVEPEAPGALPVIEATNCVYHDLAAEHPAVCQFDLSLLSGLTGTKAVLEKCIREGDDVCRFCFKKGK
ncbi:MAG: HTH domain-containing protein [Micavibrio aeruginosavorus]|nr:HTH domain-containing protein [Micavibrio aeruginosavorus]